MMSHKGANPVAPASDIIDLTILSEFSCERDALLPVLLNTSECSLLAEQLDLCGILQ
jgi:hypothetical protein